MLEFTAGEGAALGATAGAGAFLGATAGADFGTTAGLAAAVIMIIVVTTLALLTKYQTLTSLDLHILGSLNIMDVTQLQVGVP